MFGSIASIPLGYNHSRLRKLARKTDISMFIHKPATGLFPFKEYPQLLEKVFRYNIHYNIFWVSMPTLETLINVVHTISNLQT